MLYTFECINHFWIFAAFVPPIKNLPRVRMTGQSASGILSGITKKKYSEVRHEDDVHLHCYLLEP